MALRYIIILIYCAAFFVTGMLAMVLANRDFKKFKIAEAIFFVETIIGVAYAIYEVLVQIGIFQH